tara:strand:+ start:303 stop:848 length:546 start_codon:yes stop_codon:yes gene_type:complete
MAWKYYKNGVLRAESDDIPETMEDAIMELQANGHDISDCVLEPEVVKDCWSPDYPPEEDEYNEYSLTHTVGRDDIENTPLQRLFVEPLTDEEVEHWEKFYKKIEEENRALKAGDDFMKKVWEKAKPSRLSSIKSWWINFKGQWTDEDLTYLIGWIFIGYLMIGVVKYQPSILNVILWPFIK